MDGNLCVKLKLVSYSEKNFKNAYQEPKHSGRNVQRKETSGTSRQIPALRLRLECGFKLAMKVRT